MLRGKIFSCLEQRNFTFFPYETTTKKNIFGQTEFVEKARTNEKKNCAMAQSFCRQTWQKYSFFPYET